jgi:hypothetical protein
MVVGSKMTRFCGLRDQDSNLGPGDYSWNFQLRTGAAPMKHGLLNSHSHLLYQLSYRGTEMRFADPTCTNTSRNRAPPAGFRRDKVGVG